MFINPAHLIPAGTIVPTVEPELLAKALEDCCFNEGAETWALISKAVADRRTAWAVMLRFTAMGQTQTWEELELLFQRDPDNPDEGRLDPRIVYAAAICPLVAGKQFEKEPFLKEIDGVHIVRVVVDPEGIKPPELDCPTGLPPIPEDVFEKAYEIAQPLPPEEGMNALLEEFGDRVAVLVIAHRLRALARTLVWEELAPWVRRLGPEPGNGKFNRAIVDVASQAHLMVDGDFDKESFVKAVQERGEPLAPADEPKD